jgi:hypothetical protein
MIEVNGDNYKKYLVIANDIIAALDRIENDTNFYSSPTPIKTHPEFLRLVAMGTDIIPFIFRRMTEHGTKWTHFYLLHKITGHSPVKEEDIGYFDKILIAWLQWYVESQYYYSDVYQGLVK